MTTITAEQALTQTFAFAEENQLKEDYVPYVNLQCFTTGDRSDQGDVLIWRFDSLDQLPAVVESKEPILKLAPGDSKGSRHILLDDSVKTAKFYNIKNPSPLQGPVWINEEETVLTHPEHNNQVFAPGCYFATYQLAHADEVRRVQD